MDYGKQQQPVANSIQVAGVDAAHANEYFELFVNATSMKHILGYYRGLVDSLHLRPNVFNQFYPKLRANLTSWRAKALLKKFDSRAAHKCYLKGKVAANTRVLVIGGGPCGMRTAIEAQLLGAKVVVVEKRDRFSRNNVLHLWPFVIEDLRMLGAKKFFGKFCAGAIDHISIRQLQCILLKVALLLGIEVHTELSFENLVEPDPDKKIGWRAAFKPSNHPVSQYEFDVVIGADGKRNTLQGFSRKEFRGKLAIAITANFINKKTEAEACVEEISGVAFIFNQKFFKDLQEATKIDLENIVYYKDDTHYFVMTAKKHSLIQKGVIKQDFSDTERLLAPENVDKEALQNYAIEAANFSTNYQMPNLDFAVNHYGQPDVAMFDFTSMYAAENASKVVERHGCRLLKILVGDSLLEPFWPTGSGCARGFLSALDAAWAIRSWSMGTASPLDTIAERESIYRLLAQTTPDNLNKDWKSYTLDPVTRYPNLNRAVVLPHQVVCLYDTDNPASIERMKRSYNEKPNEIPKKRRRGNVDNEVLLNWLKDQLKDKEEICITDMDSVFKDGKVLCAIIHHYRPDLLDYSAINSNDSAVNNQIAIDVLEKDLCVPPVMTGSELTITEDYLTLATYLTEIYDCFRGEIPFIKHAKMKHPSKNPKIMPLNQCIRSHVSSQYIKEIPCKKCFDAYHSKLVFYSNDMEKKLLAFNHKCQSVIIPQANNTLMKENDVEIVYKKSSNRLKGKKPSKRAEKKKSISKIQSNYRQNENKCIYDSPKSSIQSFFGKKSDHTIPQTQEDIQRRCIEKIYSKHQKLKVFLTKLLLKRKSSEILKQNFATAGTQTDILKNSDLETYRVKNNSVQTDNEVYLRNRGNQTDTVEIINEQTDINNSDDNDERDFSDQIANQSSENRQKDKHFVEEPVCQAHDNTATNHYSLSSVEQDFCSKSVNEAGDFCQEKPKKIKKFSPTNSIEKMIKIRLLNRNLNKLTLQTIEYACYLDHLTISSKIALKNVSKRARMSQKSFRTATKLYNNSNSPSIGIYSNIFESRGSRVCPFDVPSNCDYRLDRIKNRVVSQTRKMIEGDGMSNQIYSRVSNWITSNDFMSQDNAKSETGSLISNSKITDITSVSKMDRYNDIVVEERTDVVNFSDSRQTKSSEEDFADKLKNIQNKTVRNLSKYSQYSPFQYCANLRSTSAPPTQFSVIVEGEEPELPPGSTKMSEVSFKTIKTASMQQQEKTQPSAPSSRHKHKHSDIISQKPGSIDRKPRKRRTMEKVGASVMFDLFFNGFIEAGVVGILLFIMDIIINSEQYDLQNYIFNT
ncbi:unnamed protein product [Psylliodes chrysocephalus]|uniref:F-actin monooxygenase n=1 Tax=Psylliodes chrysocephalus TaxID=3402493 RepID=A0A9P0CMS4_9CUCU|nr:unnamed protein product [Psylliodes chrysocephala]